METERITYLLAQQRAKRCTLEELNELETWFNENNIGKAEWVSWLEQAGGEDVVVSRSFDRFQERIGERSTSFGFKWVFAAAAAILIISVTGLMIYQNQSVVPTQRLVQQVSRILIRPGGDKATLTLSNGRRIVLDHASNGNLAIQNGVQIEKTINGNLIYHNKNVRAEENSYNTLTTPIGGKFGITLSDGTEVILDALSSISYPVTFKNQKRIVKITGQAYFKVVHNAQNPFVVEVNGQTITDIGTEFNIKAYQDDNYLQTTLVEGKASIANSEFSAMLIPGKQAVVKQGEQKISVKDVKVQDFTAWKNNLFIFRHESISSIMKQAARWYGIEVIYKGKVGQQKFGGTISREDNLNDLLENMRITGGIQYKIEGRRVYLMN